MYVIFQVVALFSFRVFLQFCVCSKLLFQTSRLFVPANKKLLLGIETAPTSSKIKSSPFIRVISTGEKPEEIVSGSKLIHKQNFSRDDFEFKYADFRFGVSQ
jgi:hypothetical protein